jgi:hypothetical protein
MLKPFLGLSLALAAVCACDSGSKGKQSGQETCALMGACLPSEVTSFGECVYLMKTFDTGLGQSSLAKSDDKMTKVAYECITSASTCDDLLACVRPTQAQLALCDSTKEDTCSGDVLVSCGSKDYEGVQAQDCSKAGLVCGSSENGAWCGLATCDPNKTPPKCEGNTLFTCNEQGNVLKSEDCAASERTCGKTPDGSTGCVGKVECTAGSARCDGTVMVNCEHGTEARHDCRTLGSNLTCDQAVGEDWITTSCVSVGHDCTIGAGETCSKGVIAYCNLGQPDTYDCKSAGLTGCTTTENSTAVCVK